MTMSFREGKTVVMFKSLMLAPYGRMLTHSSSERFASSKPSLFFRTDSGHGFQRTGQSGALGAR
jgi:hypothetical protein